MSVSTNVTALLKLRGKKQLELAEELGKSKQSMSNKIAKNSWFASDLVKVADFCGCKLAFILPDGNQLIIDDNEE